MFHWMKYFPGHSYNIFKTEIKREICNTEYPLINFKGLVFLLKQVCLQEQSFKTGMSNQQRENVLTYGNFKELSGFRKYGVSR